MLASFSSAFLKGEPRTAGFLADFRDPQARSRSARAAAQRRLDPRLLAELEAQNQGLGESAARRQNLAALRAPGPEGTAVVVAGQQVALFLGPLFAVYRAASAIAAARLLQEESGVRCVPLFWLQTEDHDYPEIHHCYVPQYAAPPLRLQVADDSPELARVSIAHRRLGPEVTAQLEVLAAALGAQPHAAEFLPLLRAHYVPGATFGAAFAGVLAALFAEEGLLVLDPRRAAIAELAAPLHHKAIVQQEAITAALLARKAALHDAGCAEQIPTRPGTALCFLHDVGATGPRYRLEREAGTDALSWSIPAAGPASSPASVATPGGGSGRRMFTQSELLALLTREPLRFSSSALLRPVIQDFLLPTAAYVAGPGEISYFAQVAPVYDQLGVAAPLVMPRGRLRCLEDNTRSWLGKLGLQPHEVEVPRAELLRRLAARLPQQQQSPDALRQRMLADISLRLSELEAQEAALRDPVRRARETIERTVTRLVERYTQAQLERDHVTAERVDRVQGFLFPEGGPQERFFSLPYFACRYGAQTFKQKVLAKLIGNALLSPAVRDVEL